MLNGIKQAANSPNKHTNNWTTGKSEFQFYINYCTVQNKYI